MYIWKCMYKKTYTRNNKSLATEIMFSECNENQVVLA